MKTIQHFEEEFKKRFYYPTSIQQKKQAIAEAVKELRPEECGIDGTWNEPCKIHADFDKRAELLLKEME